MPELSVQAVIRAMPTDELVDAIESMLGLHDPNELVFPVLDEIERRNPQFEI